MFEGIFGGKKKKNVIIEIAKPERLSQMGEHAKAVALCDKMIAEEPNERMYYAFRGRYKLKCGDEGAAIADFDKADELDPEKLPGTSMHARVLDEIGRTDEGLQLLEKRMQEKPAVKEHLMITYEKIKTGKK